jgi:hypothetical protein
VHWQIVALTASMDYAPCQRQLAAGLTRSSKGITSSGDDKARILHNGTICYVNTGIRELGITAKPRLSTYLKDLQAHGHQAIECPFGSTTIYPEKHAIAQNEKWDIATFEIPEVFVNAADRSIDTQHRPLIWPPRPRRVQKSDVVIYGGVPGVLREEKGSAAELPFQWVGAIERHAAA